MAKSHLFDVINDLTQGKKRLIDQVGWKEYNPFMINRALSQYPDTVHDANEMNKYHELPKEIQHDFFFHRVSKGKRYSSWAKAGSLNNESIDLIKAYYGYSTQKAMDALEILTDEQLEAVALKMSTGGISK